VRIEAEIPVEPPIDEVWAFFEQLENLTLWDRGVGRVERLSPDGAVGATFKTYDRRGRRPMLYEVTESEPPHRLSALTRSGYFKVATWTFVFQPSARGTVATCVSTFTLRARYVWLYPVLAFLGPRAIRRDLAALKHALEKSTSTDGRA
jgi:uncharacterized protein YndB with AHSA1/START domain